MTGPGFSPPDLERRLAWQSEAQRFLGRNPSPLELKEMEVCFSLGWTPEEFARTMNYLSDEPSEHEPVPS